MLRIFYKQGLLTKKYVAAYYGRNGENYGIYCPDRFGVYSFFGFCNSVVISWVLTGCDCELSSMSFGVSEKNATSAPETNAVQKRSIKMARKPSSKLTSMLDKNPGSGSK